MGDSLEGFQQPFYGSKNPYGTGRPVLPSQSKPVIPYQGVTNAVRPIGSQVFWNVNHDRIPPRLSD